MKAITLIQPWATLKALGEKDFETRSWKTEYKGELLIHAGKSREYLFLCDIEPFKSVLAKHGYTKDNLPLGAIIAKTNLICCLKVTETKIDGSLKITSAILENNLVVKGNEIEFGNYSKGRYAWKMVETEIFNKPIPAKGQQRLWEYDLKL